jgi:hypothetical protein
MRRFVDIIHATGELEECAAISLLSSTELRSGRNSIFKVGRDDNKPTPSGSHFY